MSLLLGLDIGTSGAKALLIDAAGTVKAEAMNEYPMFAPRPMWTEQNPEDWWQATVKSVRQVLAGVEPGQVAAMGLTGQMHGLVLLDRHGDVLRPCIMWNDQRTAHQCGEITERVGLERLLRMTGKPALTGFTAGKVLWVRENEPDVYRRAATILLPKDYVRYRLTGTLWTDVADGSGTNLMDVGQRRWSEDVTRILEIPAAWLPELRECADVCCQVSAEAAAATGLRAGTPVIVGAGDQAAQAMGTGITDPGTISVTIGTSGVVFAATDRYTPDPTGGLHAYCHAAPDRWHLMGVTLAAGGSLRWFRDTLCEPEKSQAQRSGRDPYDIMTEAAARVAKGCEELLFLPYLSGERSPHADPNARGVFFGLSLRHTRAHMTRAVMEGVTFSLRECLELLLARARAHPDCRIRVSGGGARSALWRQMMADIFNLDVAEVNVVQGASYGVALLAGVGVGLYRSAAEACAKTIREVSLTKPGPGREAYDRCFERYRALYPALREEFKKTAAGEIG